MRTVKLITESSFNYNLKEEGKDLFIEGIFSTADVMNNNGRRYPRPVLDREITKLMESVKNKTCFGELAHPDCFSSSAKILTMEGWKYFEDVRDDEKVYTLNPQTEVIEEHQITKRHKSYYKGKMITFKGKNIDTMVTPNHRMYVHDRYNNHYFATAQSILDDRDRFHKYHIPRTAEWVGVDQETMMLEGVADNRLEKHPNLTFNYKDTGGNITIPMDVFVSFLGIYMAEGGVSPEPHNRVTIYQNIGDKCDKIEQMLSLFPEEMSWSKKVTENKVVFSLSDVRLARYLRPLGDIYTKRLPVDMKQLPTHYLELLVDWFCLGDGRSCNNSGWLKRDVFSVSERLIDDLHEIYTKCGHCGFRTTQISTEEYEYCGHIIKPENKKPLHILCLGTSKDTYLDKRFLKVEEVDFEGDVYCVTVPPNETIYIMDNGKCFWSGNSPELNLDRVAVLTTELKWVGDDVMGKAKILSETPMGHIASVLIKEGNLGISSRGLGTVNEGDNYVNEDFNLLRYDLVGDPSNPGSWVKGIYEGRTFTIPGEDDVVVPVEPVIVVPTITLDEARKEYKRHIWQVLEQIGREI